MRSFLKNIYFVLLLNSTQYVNFETFQPNSLFSPCLKLTHIKIDSR